MYSALSRYWLPKHPSLFRAVLLPGLLSAIATFTLILLLFPPQRPRPIPVSPGTTLSGEVYLALTSQERTQAIRQVGIAIILAVCSGVATVECLRRWQTFQEAGAVKAKRLGLEDFLQVASTDDLVISEASTAINPARLSPPEHGNPWQPAAQGLEPSQSEGIDLTWPTEWAIPGTEAVIPEEVELSSGGGLFEGAVQVLASRQHYQTCRVRLPHSEYRHLAIALSSALPTAMVDGPGIGKFSRADEFSLKVSANVLDPDTVHPNPFNKTSNSFNNTSHHHASSDTPSSNHALDLSASRTNLGSRYYTFVRHQPSRDRALQMAQRLAEQGQRLVITHIRNGYALWRWDAEAYPELVE